MVRQVKKFIVVAVIAVALLTAGAMPAFAATYNAYEGNLSSSQLTYFRDILGGVSILDNYVVFREGQYDYTMLVGDIEYNSGVFSSSEECATYRLNTTSGYNSSYTYETGSVSNFTLNTNQQIVYSDLGNFPQLEVRGQRYEILTAIILGIAGICYLIRNIFYYRKR